ncbi:MAG TPA: EamA family transporter RarD [Noviherbaspirillum sp.]|uniref:EamA family transporter RarD n=1 Tax=Noviherbaspirillum sp. TaxID=1926288 RepID=UPI002DDD0C15|nr:EamA family transporter RarD [Noviherbaspirillum sp.]HEV2610527.1 EamA family transporter RarD [Noviherbaspirillum sp.]
MHAGMLYAAAAYAMWGLFPVYFKALQHVPASEILVHRMVWSLLLVVVLLSLRKQWAWLGDVMRKPKVLAGFAASAVLLASNWFIYIWAVNHDRVVESSLGYFINPLFNVLLGFIVLRERMRPGQWAAIAIAACGVLWLTWQVGHLPWIALALAATFGLYGLLRKTAALGALEGLALETLLLFPLALGYLVMLSLDGQNSFTTGTPATRWLLAIAGPITAIPLLCFAAGARRIPMSVLGLLQYIGPTLQLMLGVWLYNEAFDGARLIGFALIWTALLVYSAEGLWRAWSAKATAA